MGAAGVPPGVADARPGEFSFENLGGTVDSTAVFSHVTAHLDDHFSLIAGLRVSQERSTGFFSSTFSDPLLNPLALSGTLPGIPYNQHQTEYLTGGTAGLEYRPDENMMFYLTYNHGVKAGGVNLDPNAAGTPGSVLAGTPGQPASPKYQDETNDAYEIGTKIDWLNHDARTNFDLFYYDLHDLQVAQFFGLRFAVVNAPSATVEGAELEQTFKLSHDLTLDGDATWLPTATFGNSAVLGAPLSGRRFASAPKWASNISLHDINRDY